jgi:hypothetical protein
MDMAVEVGELVLRSPTLDLASIEFEPPGNLDKAA